MRDILDLIQSFVYANGDRRISMFIDAQKELLRFRYITGQEEDLSYSDPVSIERESNEDGYLLNAAVNQQDILNGIKHLGFESVLGNVNISELGLYSVRAVMNGLVYCVKVWIVPKA